MESAPRKGADCVEVRPLISKRRVGEWKKKSTNRKVGPGWTPSSSPTFKLLVLISLVIFEFNAFTSFSNPTAASQQELAQNFVRKGPESNKRGEDNEKLTSSLPARSTSALYRNESKTNLPPLIFGVGQGTTGTHSMFLATCHMNVTSVHGIETCLYGKNRSDVDPHMIDGFKAHALAVKYYKKIRSCAHPHSECSFDDADRYVEKLRGYIREVILSPIGAVHDTPYSFMTKYVMEVATKERGIAPILMHSEREAQRWAARRAEAHPIAVVCKFFFEYDHERLKDQGAFDLEKCINLALHLKQEKGVPMKQYEDVFASYRQLMDRAGNNVTKLEELTHFNKVAIETYQTAMRELNPIYTIDMFEREGFTDAPTIAKEFDEVLWTKASQDAQDRLRAAGVTLMDEPVPHRKGRYSRMHPFLKGLIKKNGTKIIVG
jgi:hypothetical protein